MRKSIVFIVVVLLAALAVTACDSSDTPTPTPTEARAPNSTPGANGGTLRTAGFPDIASVVEKVLPAVVQVIATVPRTNVFGQPTEGTSQGSAVFFDEKGYLLTNNHVVEDASRVRIVLSNRLRLDAEVIGTDPDTDLAVLKVDPDEVGDLVVAKLGDTDAMRIGDWVIAIGSPLGFDGSVTVGIVSAKGRSLNLDQNSPPLTDLVQTDAVINPGNSGGPLLNLAGEVIGINTAIIRGSIGNNQEAEGIGFAISMGTAIPVSRQLIDNGRVIRPRIGVFILDVNPVVAAERGLSVDEGVLITALTEGAPAERAGLQVNDVIVQVGDTPVTNTTDLVRLFLTGYRVGETVEITVVRSAVTHTFKVELEEVNS